MRSDDAGRRALRAGWEAEALAIAVLALAAVPAALAQTAPAADGTRLAVRVEAQPPEFGDASAAALEKTRQLVAERLDALPGFSLAVRLAGRGEVAFAGGFADLETQRPVTFDTRFRIGSTSKAITSALAGRLRDQGLLQLQRPLVEYTKTWSGHAQLTMEHLLANQSGIRHYRGMEPISRKHYDTLRDGLAIFLTDKLAFEPGSDFAYSSYGFNLAGVVLGELAGSDYLAAARELVFRPLAMTSTGPDDVTVDLPQRAAFYRGSSQGSVLAPPVDDSYKWPSGGLLSTPRDMVRFGAAFLGSDPGFLSAETFELLTSARATPAGDTGYALGWRVRPGDEAFAHRALHHGGSSVGGRSMLLVVPEAGVVVSILCNSQAYDSKEDDAFQIARWFIEATVDRSNR